MYLLNDEFFTLLLEQEFVLQISHPDFEVFKSSPLLMASSLATPLLPTRMTGADIEIVAPSFLIEGTNTSFSIDLVFSDVSSLSASLTYGLAANSEAGGSDVSVGSGSASFSVTQSPSGDYTYSLPVTDSFSVLDDEVSEGTEILRIELSVPGRTFSNGTSSFTLEIPIYDDDPIIANSAGGEINGTPVADDMRGGDGADILNGLEGRDTISGGAGNDTLNGGAGTDTIDGGDGDDYITGGGNGDRLTGGAGDDSFYEAAQIIGAFSSRYDGGDGNDTVILDAVGKRIHNYSFRSTDGLVSVETIRLENSDDTDPLFNLVFGAKNMTMQEIVNASGSEDARIRVFMDFQSSVDLSAITITGDFADGIAVTGGSSSETIIGFGNRGAFYSGASGDDTITGGAMSDQIFGEFNNDTLYGDAAIGLSLLSPEGEIYRAYQAVFDRAPDLAGFNLFTGEVIAGRLTQTEVIAQFVESAEFDLRYGALDNQAFMEQLYQNVLGRAGDTESLNAFVASLDAEAQTRADVVVTFANSAEFVGLMTAPSAAFAINNIIHPAEGQVFRIYQAVFNRAPDQGGFTAFVNSVQAGVLSVEDITAEFITSQEFQDTYGALSNEAFIEALYTNVLPGNTDADGRAAFTAALDTMELTRAQVVAQFSESPELRASTEDAADAFVGNVFADSGDTIDGGTGNDVLFGGRGADSFVFDITENGQDIILDFTLGIDLLTLFGSANFDSFAEVIAVGTQVGQDTVFDFGGGNTITLNGVILEDLVEGDLGIVGRFAAEAPPAQTGSAEITDTALYDGTYSGFYDSDFDGLL